MTETEFATIKVGDILSHGLIPWSRWIVVSRSYEERLDINNKDKKRKTTGWFVCRVVDDSSVGSFEQRRISTPSEWSFVSKVVTREKYEQ